MLFTRMKYMVAAISVMAVFVISVHTSLAQKTAFYSPDLLAMQGDWVRADAPYIIELKQGTDSKLQARYFNRRYIHVEKTETTQQDGKQFVMIELRDKNYDGSLYLLGYDRTKDTLEGVYIHGASGQRFSVTFRRKIKGS